MGDEKETTGNAGLTIVKVLNYAAVAAVILGVVIGIVTAAGSEHMAGPLKFAEFLEKSLYGIFFGGVLAAFAELVKAKQ
jgi:cytosine/uracil/thiamine/allantoin permease